MAFVDKESGVVVVRIAYDGDSRAGKTTNLQALSRSLSRVVYTPPQPGDRTLFFDWLEYTGGLFDGMPVRCEVVSVPGQEILALRRDLLVGTADVVVHVVDMSTASVSAVQQRLRTLSARPSVDTGPGASVPRGILVQANKCDLPHAVPLSALRDVCDGHKPAVGLREAVAEAGDGIRETFVFAVRLALDRVRELRRLGGLEERRVDAGGGDALLTWLRAHESRVSKRVETVPETVGSRREPDRVDALGAFEQVLAENARFGASATALVAQEVSERSLETPGSPASSAAPPAPRLPDPTVPTGMIWPPLEGRVLLEEITNAGIDLERAPDGTWRASVGDRWLLDSAGDAEFPSLDAARQQLLASARAHAALGTLLSRPRAIVVADTGHGTWRLWQILRVRGSLREALSSVLHVADAARIADCLVHVGTTLVKVNSCRSEHRLLPPCTLDTVGPGEDQPEFVGLLSALPLAREPHLSVPDNEQLLRREFQAVVRDWENDAATLLGPLETLRKRSQFPDTRFVVETLYEMLSQGAA